MLETELRCSSPFLATMSEYDLKETDIKNPGSDLTPFEQSINKLAKLCDLVPHTLSTSETNQMLSKSAFLSSNIQHT